MADETPPIRREGREPAIRTMRSDVAEFIKTTKPSLVSLAAERARQEAGFSTPKPQRNFRKIAVLGLVLVLAIGGGSALAYYFLLKPTVVQVPSPENVTPGALIFFEGTDDFTINPTRLELKKVFSEAQDSAALPGSFRRLIIRIRKEDGAVKVLTVQDFFKLLGVMPRSGVTDNVSRPPQFFIFRSRSGPELGIMLEARNPARLLQTMFSWEPDLSRDLEALDIIPSLPSVPQSYTDFTYRNIDYRYLKSSNTSDRGIGYLYFPVRNLVAIATSEEAIQSTIDRLFEQRR
ncbi:MAG: hypothetical protein AAB650_00490 [Patescibacteria group bacterium]